jgi:hypothetical protein
MNRIDSILESSLMNNARMRELLKSFHELTKNINFDENNILTIMVIEYFDKKGDLKNGVYEYITKSIVYLNFEHNSNDYVSQKLIFITLIFSLLNYPNQLDWEHFLKESKEFKRDKLINGIKSTWKSLQDELMLRYFSENTLEENVLPF